MSFPEDGLASPPPPALRLHRLRVRRTAGIGDAFELGELSPGVNLIHGPNASGKTSTARAIEAVLWPEATDPALSVTADYVFAEATYHVDVEAGHVGVQRNGAPARAPDLPAPELRQRYHLSLHQLLAEDRGEDFAAQIARQSAGGYDVAAAAAALGFRNRPSPATQESRALEQARQRLKEATEGHESLEEEARALRDLERRRDGARADRDRAALLTHAVRHARLARDAAAAELAAGAFPEVLGRLRGDEHDVLLAIENESRELTAAVRDATLELDRASAAAAQLFPESLPSGDVHPTVAAGVELLRRQEQVVAEAERRERDLLAQVERARADIGGDVDDARLEGLAGVGFGELSAFAREAELLQAQADAVDAEVRRSVGGAGATGRDPETLRTGIHLLARWLMEGAPASGGDRRLRVALWIVAGIAAAGWALLGLHWHLAFAAVALLAPLLFVVRARPEADQRAAREREYASLRLARPEAWDVEQVQACLDALQRQLAEAETARTRAAWHDEARRHQSELADRRREVEVRRAELVARFGVAPDTDVRPLSWVADRVGRWQDAVRGLRGARAALEAAREHYAATRAELGARVSALGYAAPRNSADVQGIADDLQSRLGEYRTLRERERSAGVALAALKTKAGELAGRRASIFAGVGVTEGDTAAVAALCAQCAAYAAARQQYVLAARQRDAARGELEELVGFGPELLDAPVAQLEAERAAAELNSTELETLAERVSVLHERIARARQSSDVEASLADVAAAEAELRAARDRDLRAMVGDVIVKFVQRVTRDDHRPVVFHRARELFTRITRGRYKLEFEDGDAPSFRAVDAETGRGHPLDELSSATRVQLLLAVRVAFVETQEHGGVRLPLLLDETLGTSDDQRAEAIIDAVITLAEDGRQVFYFTAQRDEVGKWRAALESRRASFACVDLAKARGLVIEGPAELPIAAVAAETLPAPDGRTHAEYGTLLQVPPIRASASSSDAVPLWYVVDDVRALHHFLSLGAGSWGALRNLVEGGGLALLEPFPKAFARAAALAKSLDVYLEQAAVGRGRPVTRATLVEAGAVSERQMEKVVAVLEECGGQAARLVEALDAGGVPGFQRRKIAELREYLERAQHLDERTPPSAEELRTAALVAVAADISAGRLAASDVDALLRRAATPPVRGNGVPVVVPPAGAFTTDPGERVLS